MESLADRLQTARVAVGLTQEQLAKKAGVSRSTIRDIESGRIRASTKLLWIGRALRVTSTWLETGKGPKVALPDPMDTYISAESIEDLAEQLVVRGDEEVIKLWRAILAAKTK